MTKEYNQNMSNLGKVGNTFLDFAKGFTQIMTFWGGPFGFVSGAIYGAINGYQTCVNNNISPIKNPLRFIGAMLTSMCVGAVSGSVPLAGPLLMGATGSAVDQTLSKTIGINANRKLSKKEILISAIPFFGPIIAGYKRNKKMRYSQDSFSKPSTDRKKTPKNKQIPSKLQQQARAATTIPEHPTRKQTIKTPLPTGRTLG